MSKKNLMLTVGDKYAVELPTIVTGMDKDGNQQPVMRLFGQQMEYRGQCPQTDQPVFLMASGELLHVGETLCIRVESKLAQRGFEIVAGNGVPKT